MNVNGASPTTPTATQTQFHQADTTLPSNTTRDDVSPSSPPTTTHSSFPPTTNGNGTSFATTNAASPTDRSLPSGLPPVNTNQGPTVAVPASIAALSNPIGEKSGGDEVEKLKQEIKELKEKLANATTNPTTIAGLRKRGGGVSEGGAVGGEAEVKMKEAVGQGVPVEVVAGLVVGVFVMTYLFF